MHVLRETRIARAFHVDRRIVPHRKDGEPECYRSEALYYYPLPPSNVYTPLAQWRPAAAPATAYGDIGRTARDCA
jgi:hypothetical protein